MDSVTTIALLSKKTGMPARLFFKYWRDVHGVLAARIPGFDRYVQFHLGAAIRGLSLPSHVSNTIPAGARFDGIAEVGFANETARAGLVNSEIAALIQADERNLFKASLLYNLGPGASRTHVDRTPVANEPELASLFLLLGRRDGASGAALLDAVERFLVPALSGHRSIARVRVHGLSAADSGFWHTAGVANQQTPATAFDVAVQVLGADIDRALACLDDACARVCARLFEGVGRVQLYRVTATHVMVEGARPTHLGLRGLDMVQTIIAAGADNQLDGALLRQLYGTAPADH